MHSSTLLVCAVALASLSLARDVPVFTLDCNEYPDVCETHCYAVACNARTATNFRDVGRYLHYAAGSYSNKPRAGTDVNEATYRRQAIGCSTSDCPDHGLTCDEFPYASTYDGGLGCVVDRFTGPATEIAHTGVTHCAAGTQNTAHGNRLKSFYAAAGLSNGGKFQVSFNEANVNNAPACREIRRSGRTACTALRATGMYHLVSQVPGPTSYCPPRGQMRRSAPARLRRAEEDALEQLAAREEFDGEVKFHESTDGHGNKLLFPFGEGPLEPGTRVFHVRSNGTVHETVIL